MHCIIGGAGGKQATATKKAPLSERLFSFSIREIRGAKPANYSE
jgi:hypothetical protein